MIWFRRGLRCVYKQNVGIKCVRVLHGFARGENAALGPTLLERTVDIKPRVPRAVLVRRRHVNSEDQG